MKRISLIIVLLLGIFSCTQDPKGSGGGTVVKTPETKKQDFTVPEFNADSAFHYIKKQVDFGPRVPNTKEHKACAKWLASKMRSYGWKVTVQEALLEAFDGTMLESKNVIAKYRPERRRRVLLCSHWDSRPFSDAEDDSSLHLKPILGANDGASGVGVLIEIARLLEKEQIPLGVDVVFFDSEDYGQPDFSDLPSKQNTWCLGSQHWARSVKDHPIKPMYGILLDMVGAKDAMFTMEGTSMNYARPIVKKVWATAQRLGYGGYFKNQVTKPIIDDHLYVNGIANIPTIDIIQYEPESETNFGHYWHTQDDDMDVIDRATLKAVGHTVIQVLYEEAYQ